MSGKNLLIFGVAILILLGSYFIVTDEIPELGGGFGPQISNANLTNSSSSLTVAAGGAVLWTNVSSTGDWFRISNTSAFRVWCALTSTTSTPTDRGGVLLFPSTSSTGESVWEMFGARGAVACVPDGGTALVTFSYTSN